jgi:hypothetical protein
MKDREIFLKIFDPYKFTLALARNPFEVAPIATPCLIGFTLYHRIGIQRVGGSFRECDREDGTLQDLSKDIRSL